VSTPRPRHFATTLAPGEDRWLRHLAALIEAAEQLADDLIDHRNVEMRELYRAGVEVRDLVEPSRLRHSRVHTIVRGARSGEAGE
jgi:hypothetical protein